MTDFENFPVFKFANLNRELNKGGTANAVLIKPEKGLFALHAHVANAFKRISSNENHVFLPHIGSWRHA